MYLMQRVLSASDIHSWLISRFYDYEQYLQKLHPLLYAVCSAFEFQWHFSFIYY